MSKEEHQSLQNWATPRLQQEFLDGGSPRESDAEQADALVRFVQERERIKRGVVAGTPEGDAVDAETLSKMAEWDSDDPALLQAEKALRRFATGRGADGVALIERAITDRQQAISSEQRRRASMPRRKSDPFEELIDRIVRNNRKISAKELEKALYREIGNGVILDMDDTEITLTEDKKTPVKISGLKDKLTRVKKKIAKAG